MASTSTSLHTVFHIVPFVRTTQWGRWIDRLEDAFEIFNITEERRVFYLLHYMGNEAYNIVCDELAPVQPRTKSYDELIEKIQSRLLETKDLTLEKALDTAYSMELSAKDTAFLHNKGHTIVGAVNIQRPVFRKPGPTHSPSAEFKKHTKKTDSASNTNKL
ncbi:hypothetical protein QE152_g14168 [Popillia japonica]|uniref:Uncharacterized protein n=1 Tax=Popillia japonica TaxID=7064 RepID=A0AAW1L8T0_POPJA